VPKRKQLQTEVDDARQKVRNLTVMGMDPRNTPGQAALIKSLEHSARAQLKLRVKALEHAKSQHG
jgi:hypothetical protein